MAVPRAEKRTHSDTQLRHRPARVARAAVPAGHAHMIVCHHGDPPAGPPSPHAHKSAGRWQTRRASASGRGRFRVLHGYATTAAPRPGLGARGQGCPCDLHESDAIGGELRKQRGAGCAPRDDGCQWGWLKARAGHAGTAKTLRR